MTRFRVLLVALLVLLPAAQALAQEAEPIELDHSFGGGSAVLWVPDLSGLNSALDAAEYPALPEAVLLLGQTGTYGFADGPRFGFTLVGGQAASSLGERIARLGLTIGGGVLEWNVPAVGLSVGLMLGGGYATLSLVDHAPTSFEDAIRIPFRAELEQWLYAIEPSIVAYGTPLAGVSLRLQVGYLFTIGRTWKAEEIAYRYPMEAFTGPTVELSVEIRLEELLADLIPPLPEEGET